MSKDLQPALNIIEQSAHLSNEERNMLLKSLHDAKKELEIESSLERVRTVAMSMNKRDDMLDICRVISNQLELLNVKEIRNVQTAIFYKEKGTYMNYEYYAKHDKTFITETTYTDNKIHQEFADKMLKGYGEFMVAHIVGDEVKDWIAYQKTTNVFIDDYLNTASSLNYYWFSLGAVALGISTYSPLNEEETNLFKRFLKVFELSYRRYLDIEKAEAQAREAQIELSLERVRAKTMAMHNSADVGNTVGTMFDELVALGVKTNRCGILIYGDANDTEVWTAKSNSNGEASLIIGHLDLMIHPMLYNTRTAWKNKEPFSSYELSGEDLINYYKAISNYPGYPTRFNMAALPSKEIQSVFYFPEGTVFAFTPEPIPAEISFIFKRFASVFGQTYRRYLDLQKAEAQAREAQIELALERVRARTMAMQKSDELSETVFILFQQFKELGENPDQATIGVINEDEWVIEYWVTMYGNQTNRVYKFSIDEPDVTNKIYKAWKEQKRSLVIDLSGKELYDFATYRASKGGAKYNEAEKRRVINVAFFSKGLLNVQSNESRSTESIALLERFAKVFEQTYTRFLDLTNAEAQARESQIEAALERVRSRSMAMQKSEELKEVIQVVYDQFVHLNINVEHTGFIMDYKERDDMHIWLADKHEVPSEVSIPYFDSPHWNSFKEAKEKGTDFFANLLSFEEKNKFYKDLFKLIPGVPEETLEYYFSCAGLAGSTVLLDNVGLYIENFSGTPYTDEENNTLMRFGKVFQQTYTRFNDLQKAEAQALEVVKRASVDRVRAEIASMRTTKDLERITPLIWNELKTLGVPFTRCGVFIMDEEKQQVQTLLSTPDGKAIATLHVPFDFDLSITTNGVEYWRRKEIYKEHWDRDTFIRSWNKFDSLSGTSVEGSHVQDSPENLYLHLLPFLQGMLYAGNDAPLNEDELQLVQNLADAFSTAYARYEDFNKLEAAKQTVEKTLVDLKQAQTQLVQAEKMASLGELTAGIAHEIQNPLNFVNNFSDVNTELIEELKIELRQGNDEEVIAIANDIKANEEKINHHGKRADAIVKGMLQHSRSSTGQKELTDINALADEYLRLAYHGLRAKEKSFNATMKTDFDASIGKINIIPQDIGRVLLNLYNNAFYAVSEKAKPPTPKGEQGSPQTKYEPTVTVTSRLIQPPSGGRVVEIKVIDNGGGIPPKILDKIFQPFFTTKPTGQGTGLGLSLSYDIIKAHGGEIRVETKEGEGSEFVIQLPIQ